MTKTIFLILFMTACALNNAKAFEVSKTDALLIAQRVFKNECNVEKNCLLEWGAGEDFLSLGLEHFIWYPPNAPNIFKEGFRLYLQYAKETGERLPVWLDKTPFPPCPWGSREEFLSSKGSQQYRDLMDFMLRTKVPQANYLIDNTKRSLRDILAAALPQERPRISKYISQLSDNPQGLYAVIDYLDFKGAGIGNSDEFKGERWGLLQVLERMSDRPTSQQALEEFVRSARIVLTHRVYFAPNDRHEERWLQGWLRRVNTYLPS